MHIIDTCTIVKEWQSQELDYSDIHVDYHNETTLILYADDKGLDNDAKKY